MKKQKVISNWDQYKRMQCNINKATSNEQVSKLTSQYYQYLQQLLVHSPEDQAIFNDTFLKLTYKYNPEQDFIVQFQKMFKQLKGAYYRDTRCNIYYQLEEDRLNIPIPDKEDTGTVETGFIDKIRNVLQSPIV